MASPAGVIDFNSDLGESFGSYVMGLDEEIIKQVTSVNVATGFHAGDPDWMARTVKLAEENGVHVGAHPAYPDLAGFGRRDLSMTPDEIRNSVTYQVGALAAFTSGHRLQHVKPHGAMYNKAVRDVYRGDCDCRGRESVCTRSDTRRVGGITVGGHRA